MPRKKKRRTHIPQYRIHSTTGYAFVRLNRRDVYLGRRDNEDARTKYGEVIAHRGGGASALPTTCRPGAVSAQAVRMYTSCTARGF